MYLCWKESAFFSCLFSWEHELLSNYLLKPPSWLKVYITFACTLSTCFHVQEHDWLWKDFVLRPAFKITVKSHKRTCNSARTCSVSTFPNPKIQYRNLWATLSTSAKHQNVFIYIGSYSGLWYSKISPWKWCVPRCRKRHWQGKHFVKIVDIWSKTAFEINKIH